jgi:hypothetical protein
VAFNPVKNHPIHDALKRLLSLQNSAILTGPDHEIDEQHRWYLNKIFYLAQHASNGIKRRLQFSVSVNGLNNLHSSTEALIQELNNYVANRNIAHIVNAFNQSEQGFQIYMDQAIPRGNGSESTEANEIVESLQKSFQGAISTLKTERDNLTAQIAKLTVTVSTSLDSITTLQANIEKHRIESQAVITEISNSYDKLAGGLDAKFTESLIGWTKEQEQSLDKVETETSSLVEKISDKENEARGLVQSVGDILTTGTYKIRAQKESELSDRFRWMTIGLFSIGIAIVLSNYAIHFKSWWNGTGYEETPWTIATRLLTALVIALPAFYTARESARHRTNSDRATQRELELSTLGPFIELMPPEMRSSIRDRLTDRYFGSTVEAHKVESPLDPDTIAKIVEVAIKSTKQA